MTGWFDADESQMYDESIGLSCYLTREDPLIALFEEGVRVFFEQRTSAPIFRRCEQCEECVIRDCPDPCLGYLPGVMFACCGHGVGNGYILFDNGTTIRFNDARVDGFPGPTEELPPRPIWLDAGEPLPDWYV